jgi:hypothetical protein
MKLNSVIFSIALERGWTWQAGGIFYALMELHAL